MGTHNDGKKVTVAGFPGKYWKSKELRETIERIQNDADEEWTAALAAIRREHGLGHNPPVIVDEINEWKQDEDLDDYEGPWWM